MRDALRRLIEQGRSLIRGRMRISGLRNYLSDTDP